MSTSDPGSAGQLLTGVGKMQAAEAEQSSLEYQAKADQNNANLALQQGQYDAGLQQMKASKTIGRATASYGASGVDLSSGSPAAVLAASAANAELDRMNILHGADIKALNYKNQAALDLVGADNAGLSAKMGLLSGFIGGSSSMIGNSKNNNSKDDTYGGAYGTGPDGTDTIGGESSTFENGGGAIDSVGDAAAFV